MVLFSGVDMVHAATERKNNICKKIPLIGTFGRVPIHTCNYYEGCLIDPNYRGMRTICA